MNLSDNEITEIFFHLDEFTKEFEQQIKQIPTLNPSKRTYKTRKPKMSYAEVMTVMVTFHLSGARTLKHYYINYVQKHLAHLFPKTFSYNRFVEVQHQVFLPLAAFLQCKGECTGISFIDSTIVRVCKNKRIKRNKVFKGLAELGKSSVRLNIQDIEVPLIF